MDGYSTLKPKHYDARLLRILRDGAYVTAVLNVVLGFFFYSYGIMSMVPLCIVAFVLYCALPWLLRRGRVMTSIVLAWAEIAGYVGVAGVVLGPESGFHYYLLIIIPLIFICSPAWTALNVTLAAVVGIEFLVVDQQWLGQAWRVDLGASVIDGLRLLNAAAALLVAAYLAAIYGRIARNAERGLAVAANTDHLSGLSNRRHALEVMRREAAARDRDDAPPLAFVLGDIDNFKTINDTYGHATGDRVIAHVSASLKAAVRSRDLVVRWGGEEFLVVLPATSIGGAHQFADRVCRTLAAQAIAIDGEDLSVTGTFGISEHRRGESVENCLRRADEALYHGKRTGKNKVVVWTPELAASPQPAESADALTVQST